MKFGPSTFKIENSNDHAQIEIDETPTPETSARMVIQINDTVRCKPEVVPFLDLSRQQLQRLFDAYTILESFSLTKIEFRRIVNLSFIECCDLDEVDTDIADSAEGLFDSFDIHGKDVVDSLELLSAIALLNKHLSLEDKLRFVLGLYEFEYPFVGTRGVDEGEDGNVFNQAMGKREESFFTIEQVQLSFRSSALGLGKLSNLWMDRPPDLDSLDEIAKMAFSYKATDEQQKVSFENILFNCIHLPEMKWLRYLDDVFIEGDK